MPPAARRTSSAACSRRRCPRAWASRSSSTTGPVPRACLPPRSQRKRRADGYTLLMTTTSIYAILPNLRKNLPYDAVEGLRAGVAHRDRVERARRQHRRCPRNRSPSSCSSRRTSRDAQLRVGRRRLARAPRRRDAQPARRHQDDAHPLQGRRPGAARRHRRQRAGDDHLADRGRRAHERRARPRARHDRRGAQSGPARPADDRRRRARLRHLAVVGHRGAGRHAARRSSSG